MEKFTMALFHERLYKIFFLSEKNACQPQSADMQGTFW